MAFAQFFIALKAAIFCNGKLLILKRREDDWRGGEWDLPGGGEIPTESVKREIMEETGLNVVLVKPLHIWSMDNEHQTKTVGITFLACLDSAANLTLSDEHSEYLWIDQSEIKELALPDWLEIDANLAFTENFSS